MSIPSKILSAGPQIAYPPPFSSDERIVLPRFAILQTQVVPSVPIPDTSNSGTLTPIVYTPYEKTKSGQVDLIQPSSSSQSYNVTPISNSLAKK